MKKYMKPTMEGQMFVSNEFVSACGDSGKIYNFVCDAGDGPYTYVTTQCGIFGCKEVTRTDDYPYDVYEYTSYGSNFLNEYCPCDEKHEAPASNEFVNGYMIHQYTNERTEVIIWKGLNGRNVHCTENLDINAWETAKS